MLFITNRKIFGFQNCGIYGYLGPQQLTNAELVITLMTNIETGVIFDVLHF